MIPSFSPIETWVMRIFPYLVNYDTTTNERIKSILQKIEKYKHQFSQMSLQGNINKIKSKFYSIFIKCEKLVLTMQVHMKTMFLNIPKQSIITPK